MIYGLQWVPDHPVYKLHDAAGFFVETGLKQAAFGDACFPIWFKPVVDASPAMRALFEQIFLGIQAEGSAARASLIAAWQCQDNIQGICQDSSVRLVHCSFRTAALRTVVGELFDHLYKDSLVAKTFEDAVGGTLADHYQRFRDQGQRVCPFCGLENYKDRNTDTRASYDHYLLRSQYPLASVNFKNLVPMCDICNEAPNKGIKDVLFSDRRRRRRRPFCYPYGAVSGIGITLKRASAESPGRPSKWKVTTTAVMVAQKPIINAWKAVFRIDRRYAARMQEASSGWVRDFLHIKAYAARPTPVTLQQDFLAYSQKLNSPAELKEVAEAALRSAFFRFLATQVPSETLQGYTGISTSPAIQNIPTTNAVGN
jgi:hypothetical protein